MSREEVSSLQFLPPWRLRGATVNYGLALLSCYFVCDLLSVVSGGYYYMFDPRGSVLAAPSTCTPAAKMFSLTGNYSLIIPSFKLFMLYDVPNIFGFLHVCTFIITFMIRSMYF